LYYRHAFPLHASNFYRLWLQDSLILRIPFAFVGYRVTLAHRLNLTMPCVPTWSQRAQPALPITFSPLTAVAEVGLERRLAHFKNPSTLVTVSFYSHATDLSHLSNQRPNQGRHTP
jgi:hypothetical protein